VTCSKFRWTGLERLHKCDLLETIQTFEAESECSINGDTDGTVDGTVKAGAMSFARFSTYGFAGQIVGYVGEGAFTNDPLHTFGAAGVVEIPKMQELLRYICENGSSTTSPQTSLIPPLRFTL
jgi:hypothetical protein